MINKISNSNYLINSFLEARKSCSFKNSVQQYEINLLRNIRKTQIELRTNTYHQKDFYNFYLNERGKERYVRAICFYDRVVQRSLCDELCKIVYPYLIYDNGASVKNKGIDFSRCRIENHLHHFYRKYGNKGYALLIDFRKFYDNINHDKLIKMYKIIIKDEDTLNLISHLINSFSVDISDYEVKKNEPFDSLKYSREKHSNEKKNFLNKSLGIGSQISQISGLLYPRYIDNYCKIVKGIKYYGRYMDDIYIFSSDKQWLHNILKEIKEICLEYDIFINEKKTHIFRLDKGFTFLKIKYRLTDTGHLVKIPAKDNIVRERRKLKSFKKMVVNGEMEPSMAMEQYKSWRGNIKKYDCHKSLMKMDKLYDKLFFYKMEEKGNMRAKDKYKDLKEKYSNYIVIIKEGIFFKTFEDDAIIMWNMFKYNWHDGSIAFGNNVLDKVCDKLKEQGLGYRVIVSEEENISFDGNNEVYNLYLNLSKILYSKYTKKEELKEELDRIIEENENNYDKIKNYFNTLIK